MVSFTVPLSIWDHEAMQGFPDELPPLQHISLPCQEVTVWCGVLCSTSRWM